MTLNVQQQKIYDAICAGKNIAVLDSEGGTGKSYLLKKLQEDFSNDTLFLSTTGVSAINIDGMTMHRAMSLPLGVPTPQDIRKVSSITSKLFSGNAVKRIVIDEASMITVHMWYVFCKRLERFNKRARGRHARNIQIILFGDVFQLGAITRGYELTQAKEIYGTDKYFLTKEFDDMNFTFMDLNIVVRQSDVEMKRHLSNIRKGYNLEEAIAYFNDKCYHYPLPTNTTYITTTNKKVDEYNNKVFYANKNPCALYTATIRGKFEERDYPCEYELRLKVGLKVMTLRNDKEDRWVNGSTGNVVEVSGLGVLVKFDHSGEEHLVEAIEYERYEYGVGKNEQGEDEVVRYVAATFSQIPLRQCSAITGFKAQGATLDKAIIDLGNGAGWANGLLYVMLSRLTSTEGLHLKRKIKLSDISVCQDTLDWIENKG